MRGAAAAAARRRLTRWPGRSLAIRAQLLLGMNRADVAEKVLELMKKVHADATLTQVVSAWIDATKVGGGRGRGARAGGG